MSNNSMLQIKITLAELLFIVEAMEGFVEQTKDSDCAEQVSSLFARLETRMLKEIGEPEEGY